MDSTEEGLVDDFDVLGPGPGPDGRPRPCRPGTTSDCLPVLFLSTPI